MGQPEPQGQLSRNPWGPRGGTLAPGGPEPQRVTVRATPASPPPCLAERIALKEAGGGGAEAGGGCWF